MKQNTSKYLICTAFILLISCSPKIEKKIEVTDPTTGNKSDVTVSKSLVGNEINIVSEKDGATVKISEGTIPSGMPKYVKLYPNATDISNLETSGGGDKKDENAIILSFKSKDAPSKIIEFYKNDLTPQGYTQKANMNMGPLSMATIANESSKEVFQIMASIDEATKDTMVQVIYVKEIK